MAKNYNCLSSYSYVDYAGEPVNKSAEKKRLLFFHDSEDCTSLPKASAMPYLFSYTS